MHSCKTSPVMSDHVWETWSSRILRTIRRSEIGPDGCKLWNGAVTRSSVNAQPYGIMLVRLPYETTRRKMRVHVLAYSTSLHI